MASKYWIKLYHELLHDPKMGRLPDRLWRRAIELFLLAGENEDNGYLPSIPDMAWTLRISEAELEADLQALAVDGLNIMVCVDGRWLVVKFARRQAPIETTERVQRFRERQRKEEYTGNDNAAQQEPGRNEDETIRSIDTELDTESDTDTNNADAPPIGGELKSESPGRLTLSSTPHRRILKGKLASLVFQPKGRRAPANFPNALIAQRFDTQAERLSKDLGRAIDAAIGAECHSLKAVTNYIAGWPYNGKERINGHAQNPNTRRVHGRIPAYSVADPASFHGKPPDDDPG